MSNELQQLLRESVSDAPPEPHTVAEIVHEARSRHRRRVGALAGGALALVLVAGAGYAVVARQGSEDSAPVVRQHQDVVVERIDDRMVEGARRAVPGEDYVVVAELPGSDLTSEARWQPGDLVPTGLEPGDDVVRGADGDVVATLDPPEGAGLPFPTYLGQGSALWSGQRTILVQDLATGDVVDLPVELAGRDDLAPGPTRGIAVEDERVWATIPVEGDDLSVVLASAPLDGSAGFRQEVDGELSSSSVVIGHGNVAWTDPDSGAMMLRDLSSGEDTELAAAREGCAWQPLGVSSQRVAAQQQCGDGATDNTTVWSLAGEGTVILRTGLPANGGLSDQVLLFQGRAARQVRTYAYVFATGEVLELSRATMAFDGAPSRFPVRASGDRIAFPASKGYTEVLAELK